MLIDSIGIITFLSLNSGILGEEILVQLDFVHKQFLTKFVDIVDQDGWFLGAAPRTQRLIESLIVFEIKFNTQFWRPVFNSDVDRNDDS